MQKTVTYHSSAVQYNDILAEAARKAAEVVEHKVVKGWCVGIAKQHEFHAERHRRALAKLERNTSENTIVDGVEIDPKAVNETDEEQNARWQQLEDQAQADLLAAEQQKES